MNAKPRSRLWQLQSLAAAARDVRHSILAEAGLSDTDCEVLAALAARARPVGRRELAIALLLPASSVDDALASLEARGCVEVRACARETVIATQVGVSALAAIAEAERALENRLAVALGAAGHRAVVAALQALRRRAATSAGNQRPRGRPRARGDRDDVPDRRARARVRDAVTAGLAIP